MTSSWRSQWKGEDMNKPISALLAMTMLVALVAPAVAVAKDGQDNSGRGASQSHSSNPRSLKSPPPTTHAEKGARALESESVKRARESEKAVHKAAGEAQHAAREASRSANAEVESDSPQESDEISSSTEGTPAVGTAFSHITTNLERSVAKVVDGRKKQLPPGLVRVWLKFAAWLGVDQTTIPQVPKQTPSTETSPTPEASVAP